MTKVHLEAIRYAKSGYDIILIGHPGHEEVEGTMGEAPYAMHLVATVEDVEKLELPQTEKLVYLTQTTLERGRHARRGRSTEKAIPEPDAAAKRRHLLRHHQPPERGERPCRALSTDPRYRCRKLVLNSQRLREVAEACGTARFSH